MCKPGLHKLVQAWLAHFLALSICNDLGGTEDAIFRAVAAAQDSCDGVGCAALFFLDGLVECWIKFLAFFSEDFDAVGF